MTYTNKYSFTLECACNNPSHMMIVEVYPQGPNEKEFKAFCYMSGDYRAPFYKRIWMAIYYIFKPNPYMFGNIICLNEKNTNSIINIGKALEEIKAMGS